MKRLALILLILLVPVLALAAPFLACNLPPTGTTISQTEVEVTIGTGAPIVYQGLATIQGTNFILYDLGAMAGGKYKFRARWADSGGWWSDWSDPLESGKPVKPGTLRVVP